MNRHNGSTTTKVSPSSPMNRTTKAWFTFHYRNSFEAESGAFQQQSGAQPTMGLGAPERPPTTIRCTTHNGIGGSRTASSDHTRVQPPQRRLGSKDPRVTSSQTFNFHESSWRAHRCTKCKRQEHKCSNPSLSNSNKATNAYGGIREEEQRGDAPRTPRSRSTRFPSLRGEMDWWKCRSRSPLSNPSKISKNHGRK